MTPQETIAHILADFVVPGKSYPTPLPGDIAPWYCYTRDGGHSIVVILVGNYRDKGDLLDVLVPAPVKSVFRAGYELRRGYVVTDLPYDPNLGLQTPEEEDEI